MHLETVHHVLSGGALEFALVPTLLIRFIASHIFSPFCSLIHLEEMRLKAKQDLLRREMSKETEMTDRGRCDVRASSFSATVSSHHPPIFAGLPRSEIKLSKKFLVKILKSSVRSRSAIAWP